MAPPTDLASTTLAFAADWSSSTYLIGVMTTSARSPSMIRLFKTGPGAKTKVRL
jgi:hypothetical protein